MGLLKSFKKILKSPIGKAALMMGLGHFGPQFLGAGSSGLGQWKNVPWKELPWWKAGLVAGGAGALAQETDDDKSKIDDTGHTDYLKARQGNINEWAQWLMDSDDTLTWEEAYAQASDPMFSKAEGGLIGLAQGGRIGLKGGAQFDTSLGGGAISLGTGISGHERHSGKTPGDHHPEIKPITWTPGADTGYTVKPTHVPKKRNIISDTYRNWKNKRYQSGLDTRKVSAMRKMNLMPGWNPFTKNVPDWAKNLTEDELNTIAHSGPYLSQQKSKWDASKFGTGKELMGDVFEGQGLVDTDTMTQTEWERLFPGPDLSWDKGQGPKPEWQSLGYPSYAAWLAAQGTGGGGGGAGTDTADYYGFKEWEDWEGAPVTPLFDDATKYKGLLSKGGRIGLYGGGMGGMSNSMNPMMNQGLGAMGSQGMNPFNQQNLMNQAQMRGQPQGRPPMPGGPTTAQGPGITSARLPKQNEDTEILQLIRMLASMGIPMEQLRGRTKEELVEMVMSISSKAQAQRGGGEEVVEESEEVVEAAHGGRIGYQGGSADPLLIDEYKKYVFEMEEQGLQPMSFEQFEAQARSGQAHGGRIGYQTGSPSRGLGGLGENFIDESQLVEQYPGANAEIYADETVEEGPVNILDSFGDDYRLVEGDGMQYVIRDDQNILVDIGIEPTETRRSAGPEATRQSPGIYDEGQGGNWFLEMQNRGGGGADYMIPDEARVAKYSTLSDMGFSDENRAKRIEAPRFGFFKDFTSKLNNLLDEADNNPEKMDLFREIQSMQVKLRRDLSNGTNESGLNPDRDRDSTPGETAANVVMKRYDMNQGGLTRTRYAMGTEQSIIPSRDGPQIDYRGVGGYQPHGAKEKKDDVRALLAQGEFVVTSDAVRGIGGGDRDVGAKRMYDLMHKYEPIGRALT